MSGDHIFIETLYGFKCVGRNVIFRIFIVLGIVGIALFTCLRRCLLYLTLKVSTSF